MENYWKTMQGQPRHRQVLKPIKTSLEQKSLGCFFNDQDKSCPPFSRKTNFGKMPHVVWSYTAVKVEFWDSVSWYSVLSWYPLYFGGVKLWHYILEVIFLCRKKKKQKSVDSVQIKWWLPLNSVHQKDASILTNSGEVQRVTLVQQGWSILKFWYFVTTSFLRRNVREVGLLEQKPWVWFYFLCVLKAKFWILYVL